MVDSCTERYDYHQLFPIPCRVFQTDGIEDGIIVRFRTFYLKIYDDKSLYTYNVQAYLYNETNPAFEIKVPANRFRKFASKFRHDDYLLDFKCPCCDYYDWKI